MCSITSDRETYKIWNHIIRERVIVSSQRQRPASDCTLGCPARLQRALHPIQDELSRLLTVSHDHLLARHARRVVRASGRYVAHVAVPLFDLQRGFERPSLERELLAYGKDVRPVTWMPQQGILGRVWPGSSRRSKGLCVSSLNESMPMAHLVRDILIEMPRVVIALQIGLVRRLRLVQVCQVSPRHHRTDRSPTVPTDPIKPGMPLDVLGAIPPKADEPAGSLQCAARSGRQHRQLSGTRSKTVLRLAEQARHQVQALGR